MYVAISWDVERVIYIISCGFVWVCVICKRFGLLNVTWNANGCVCRDGSPTLFSDILCAIFGDRYDFV